MGMRHRNDCHEKYKLNLNEPSRNSLRDNPCICNVIKQPLSTQSPECYYTICPSSIIYALSSGRRELELFPCGGKGGQEKRYVGPVSLTIFKCFCGFRSGSVAANHKTSYRFSLLPVSCRFFLLHLPFKWSQREISVEKNR